MLWGTAVAVGSLPAVGGAFFAAYSLSFMAPVLAEALNPADTDLWQLLSRPSFCSFALAIGHTGLNSIDRVFFALGMSDPGTHSDQRVSLLEVMAVKVLVLLIMSAVLRWRLARGLDLPLLSSNAAMINILSAPLPAEAGLAEAVG